MTTPLYVPDRGHFVWIDFDPQAGREQKGERPALVLSTASYNGASGLAVFCPITSKGKGYPFEVPIPSGQPVYGFVLTDALKSLDWGLRGVRYAGTASNELMDEVRRRVAALLGIKIV